jgi:hypothetical protein
MNPFSDRRIVIAVGIGATFLIAVLVGVFLAPKRGEKTALEPTREQLQLQVGKSDGKGVSKTEPVRCFVNGQLVGMTTLAECGQKNGTASQSLDVGLDQAATAATGPAPPANGPSGPPSPSPATPAECLRYGAEGWKGYGSNLTLSACVRVLFQGQCAHPGEAYYGRWGAQSLRLIPGRVEISDDNRRFHSLVEQDADCSIPAR